MVEVSQVHIRSMLPDNKEVVSLIPGVSFL